MISMKSKSFHGTQKISGSALMIWIYISSPQPVLQWCSLRSGLQGVVIPSKISEATSGDWRLFGVTLKAGQVQ